MDRKGNKDNYRSGEKRRRSSSVPYRRRGDNSYGRNDNRAYRLKRNTSDDGEGFYESDSMFFKNSAVNGDVSLRTDRADDTRIIPHGIMMMNLTEAIHHSKVIQG